MSTHISRDPNQALRGDPGLWFDAAFSTSPDGVAFFDMEGRVLRVNAAFAGMVGHAEGELAGRSREELVPPAGRDAEAMIWRDQVLPNGHSEEREKDYLHKNGTLHRGLARTWLTRDPVGHPTGVLEMVRSLEGKTPIDGLFLKTLVDTIPCPLFYKDAEGRYLGCNTAFTAVLGQPREQIIGSTVYDTSPKDLADIYRRQDLALFQARGVQTYETQVLFADGSRHDMVMYKAAFTDARGKVAGLVGVMLDITERKLAEQRLKDTLELNQKLIKASPIGIVVFNASTGCCVAANDAHCRIIGGSMDKVLADNFRELDAWKRGGLVDAAERALALGEEQHLERELISSFGKRFWISVTFTSFVSGDEKHLLVLFDDISEQRAAKEALQRNEAQYRTLAENLGEGLAMSDLSYRYTYCNPRLLEILGREEGEVLGKCLLDFVSEKDREALLERQEEHRHGPIHLFELQLRRKDGSAVDVLLSVSHLRSEQGEFLGSLELITDISEMRQFEHALQQAQLQIIQHEKMAALGTMVTGVAHEINNPTHFMLLGAKSLESGLASFKRELLELVSGDDPEVVAYLERNFSSFEDSLRRILEGFTRIRNIVQDLRLFARVGERGKREMVVTEGLELALRLAGAKHPSIRFITDFAGRGRILCSPAELNQTFLNILDNACRAIEERKIVAGSDSQGCVTTSLREDEAGVIVTISDNGCGMSALVKARMFEPFFTTRPVGQGAGLGLAVAFQVIEDHGGRIEVDSHPGEGTSVKVFLPFAMERLPKADDPWEDAGG